MSDATGANEELGGASTDPIVPNAIQVAMVGDQLRAVAHLIGKILHRQGKPPFRVLDDGDLNEVRSARDMLLSVADHLKGAGDDGGNGGGE